MIDTKDINEARKLIKSECKPIVIKAQNLQFNRSILESGKFDILLSAELSEADTLRSIGSGINNILANIATKNNIAIGIDLDEIRKLDLQRKAERLAKIRESIKTCNKEKTRLSIKGASDKTSGASLLRSLGASSQQASEALYF